MNIPKMRGYCRILSLATAFLPVLTLVLCAMAGFLSSLTFMAPAFALVGPARLAPEFAPYVVMVLDSSSGEGASYCSASVIAPDIVLTAAHCVSDPSNTQVFFRNQLGKLVFFDVGSIAIHPDYRPNSGEPNSVTIDLALLRLVEPLPAVFKPVELTDSFRMKTGQPLRIVGFGIADEIEHGTPGILRTGVLAVIKPESSLYIKLIDPDGTGLGGCTGDSGGPVFAVGRPALVAVAIRAKGNNGYSCGAVTEAVLTGPQLSWIHKILHAWGAAGSAAK
ncbi:MAG TPA: S1 family peptidase [Methylocella sp.]|nr:S1 family peptidase [Methylocella sp.]